MKKVISVLLAFIMMMIPLTIISFAVPVGTKDSFTVFNYNVAGLPDIGFLEGKEPVDVLQNQVCIGKHVNENKYDIVAVQEDFGYHENLVQFMTEYNYRTNHKGGVPYGDGTNIFTVNHKLYNEAHIPWKMRAGVLDDGADELSEKGITYCCIELADGVLIDFYNIHADAFGGEASTKAKRDNYRQTAEIINNRSVDRPVIVTGDFNDFYFGNNNLKECLIDPCQLKDAWIEVCNVGDYSDCSYYIENYGASWKNKWGKWDSVERFLYKDGGGITLTCDSFEYLNVLNRSGKKCSDHAACLSTFTYEVEKEIEDQGQLIEKRENGLVEFIRRIVSFFKSLILLIQTIINN